MPKIVLEFDHSVDVLQSLTTTALQDKATIVVCASKEDFLIQVIDQIQARNDEPNGSVHLMTVPTLGLIAASGDIRLVFCTSVPTLRAYLACYASHTSQLDTSSTARPRLLVIDLLALHHSTSEFTLQGLSRSFASLVSAAHRTGSDLEMIECKDINDPTNPNRGSRLWDTQVPLLSGSVKLGQEASRWAGKAISIRKIAERWFFFGESGTDAAKDEPRRIEVDDSEEEMII